MEILELLKAVLLGIVQGITEWLPVSSTGHMILVEQFVKLQLSTDFINTFFVVIQFGSILAVIVLFFNKLNPFNKKNNQEQKDILNLWLKVIIAVIPATIIGLLFDDLINSVLYNAITVAIMLIIYGIIFIILESKSRKVKIKRISQLSYQTSLLIGMFQVLALVPGTSRSGITIIGAVLLGCSRTLAAEFSFFLAIPIMLGASTLKLVKTGTNFSVLEWSVLLTGSIVAFLVSIVAIKFLMDFIKKHDFKVFGYYRIILGILVLAYFYI
ncbi:MAG: undecaprenyl-diphosphate phosphatase [Clostridiaceae bacterium]